MKGLPQLPSFHAKSQVLQMGQMRRLLQLPNFHTKSQVLEIHKNEQHFKVSHKKESHKVKVLARIYFSITG
jgi:hypothetical protein